MIRPATSVPLRSAEVAVSFTALESLMRFVSRPSEAAGTDWLKFLGLEAPEMVSMPVGRLSRVHFGNEFCQRLLPSVEALSEALGTVTSGGFAFGLALPVLTDDGIERADALLALLPEGTEVALNDWGLVRRLSRRFPHLKSTAGRLLCRMLKEPRAPSAAYLELGGHGFMTPGFEKLVARLGVGRVEMDVPPFASSNDMRVSRGKLSVHVPFGFATTGRICRIGNLRRPMARKFESGHVCARECLTYGTIVAATGGRSSAQTGIFQRGNTLFYRHTAEMAAALCGAITAGSVDRLVVSGDWHEARSADLRA